MYGLGLYKLSLSSGQTLDHSSDQSILSKRLRENFKVQKKKAIQIRKQPAQTVSVLSSTASPSSLEDVDAIRDLVIEEQGHQLHIFEDLFSCSKMRRRFL